VNVSDQGREFIKSWEGCRLKAYDDGVGVWTIGYGHTKGVKYGDECTQEQADAWFDEEIEQFGNQVNALVIPDVPQHQFDALVSLAYNIGVGAFSKSTLLKKLNDHDYLGAAEQFDVWNKGGGMVMIGLVRRRSAERNIFERATYANNR